VLLAAGGEVGIQPALLARLDVACAAVDHVRGQLAGVGHDPLQQLLRRSLRLRNEVVLV